MRNRSRLIGFSLICLSAFSGAAEPPSAGNQSGANPAAGSDSDKPEYSRRALPADTFKPSEEISEDFPVPFPVDI